MRVAFFPVGEIFFNKTGVVSLGFVFSNQTFKPAKEFGPYVFIADTYQYGESLGEFLLVVFKVLFLCYLLPLSAFILSAFDFGCQSRLTLTINFSKYI